MITTLFVSILITSLVLILGIENIERVRAVKVEVRRVKPKTRR